MARMLTIMVPEPGHIIPALELARALKELGHVTHFATFEHFHADIEAAGFGCIPVWLPRALKSLGTNLLYSPLSVLHIKEDQETTTEAMEDKHLLSILDVIRRFQPDLILIDRTFAKVCHLFDVLHLRYLLIGSNFGDALVPVSDFKLQRETELLLCPHALATSEDLRVPKRYYFDIPITRNRSVPDFRWEEVDLSRPLAFCTMGTQVDTYPNAPAVLKDILPHLANDLGFQVVAVVGADFQHVAQEVVSPQILLTHCAPQLDLLERAELLISHGGLGTIKEALHFAVPMFLIPFAYDQFANANRVEAAGYGKHLSSHCWSLESSKTHFNNFLESSLQLHENVLERYNTPICVANKLTLDALGMFVKSILQSPT